MTSSGDLWYFTFFNLSRGNIMSEPILGIDASKKDLSLTLIINEKSFFLNVDNNNQGFKKNL